MKLPDDFIKKIARCLEEEETDIYVMSLYALSGDDMAYFSDKDQDRVRHIFKILMDDTKHHAELLKLIIEIGEH